MPRSTSMPSTPTRTALAALAIFALAALLPSSGGASAARRGPPIARFLGAGPGTPVPFTVVPLPAVDPGEQVEFLFGTSRPFDPSFDDLVTGNVVITSNSQMHAIWLRLFAEPYDPDLFDFENSFVVLMGNGLSHPFIGFSIESVESYDASFQPFMKFQEPLVESALAVTAVTFLPGPPPPPKDDVYHVAAVRIDRALLGPVLFHRDFFAGP